MSLSAALASLALSAFISATLFPGASEAGLAAVIAAWPESWPSALVVSSVANTAGAMTSFLLGRFLPQKKHDAAAVQKLQRYGTPLLFFSWLPLVGDALPLAAGWLRMPWALSLLWIFSGKVARYAVVTTAAVGLLS